MVDPMLTFVVAGTAVETRMAITPHLSAPVGIETVKVARTSVVVGVPKAQSAAKGAGKKPVLVEDPLLTYCACFPILNDNC